MVTHNLSRLTRRRLLSAGSLGLAGLAAGRVSGSDGRPKVERPRATSGDVVQPDWSERLTVTVGVKKGDLVGATDKPIQAAVDYVARLGGGTVRILPGRYRLDNAVYLRSGVRLLGSGDESVLIKTPSISTNLAEDSDWYDQEVTLVDPAGFEVGDGVCLRTTNPHTQGEDVLKRTLVARSGNRFKLDRALRKNFWVKESPTVSKLFPVLSGEEIEDVAIENITLDGNRANNENLNGNYAGCIFLQDCNRIQMRQVTARDYNGDGISWQICHDVIVEDSHSHGHAGYGLHPGSGSQRPLMRRNRLEGNDLGLFFCWGVKYGLAENNTIVGNRRYGVSVGHRDTDNLIRDNEIRRSGVVGVLFRKERGRAFAPHRNRLENNRIIDSGAEEGIGVDVQGETESVTIADNDIRETRRPLKRTGVRIGANTSDIRLVENRIVGFANDVADLHNG
jgi:hypothetical protein